MKKITLLLSILILSAITFAMNAAMNPNADYGEYGIEYHKTLSGYQKYVGETVIYLPKETPYKYERIKFNGVYLKEYVITQITGNDENMTFVLEEKGGSTKIKMAVKNGVRFSSRGQNQYWISTVESFPLFLSDKFKKDKSKLVGKKYNHPKLKANYECVDVIFKTENNTESEYFDKRKSYSIIQNSITGRKDTILTQYAATSCFYKDLKGKYISTLIQVEKPVSSAIRYGKTKTIKEEEITKYSYVDEYIDIVIFCDGEKFNFVLKNISQSTLKLIWDEAVFINFDGSTSKVINKETNINQKETDQLPSIVIKGANLYNSATPICNISSSGVLRRDIRPDNNTTSQREVKLMLPIQIKDVINEYIFVFKFDWVYDYPELIKN